MSDALEKSLREALQREQPPEGFAERVLARAALREAAQPGLPLVANRLTWPERLQAWWLPPGRSARRGWAVALAGLVLAVVAGGVYQQQIAREQARLEAQREARQKALYALRLTGQKLAPARRALAELGINFGGDKGNSAAETPIAR